MTDRLWMMLIVMVGAIGILIAFVFQDQNRIQSVEAERGACSDQREKLAFEASELNQQVTELKEKQRETERESRRSSGKLAALEESLEKLEDERTVWEDEREKHKIREKYMKQQFDDFRSQLKAAELTTNEGNANSRTHPMLIKEFKTRSALENNEEINRIAKLNEDIFVITLGSNVIERFDSATLLTQQTLPLQGYENLRDIQPCNRSQSLFVIGREYTGAKFISNVDPYNKESINSWEVDSCIVSLSLTEDCNVIATCFEKNKIIEYSSTGHLIQEIVLKPETGIVNPGFALKMANGKFLVCYDGKHPRRMATVGVAIVNSNGDVLKSYSSPLEMTEMVMGLAIDKLGNVLIAELNSGRVMLLSPDLEYERDIVTKEHGTRRIVAMLLDEVNGRLFVAESGFNVDKQQYEDGRILVFDIK